MIGTGLTFAAGLGLVGSIIGLVFLLLGKITPLGLVAVVGRFLVAPGFLLGVGFSGALALTARGRLVERLTLPFVTALGAAGGLLYFLVIGLSNGFRVWTGPIAVVNFTLLTVMGAGAAAGMLIIARKSRPTLASGEETQSLHEGDIEVAPARRETEEKVRR
jgi:hypothetical protein